MAEEKEVDEYGFYKGKDLIGSPSNTKIGFIIPILLLLVLLYILFNLFESKSRSPAEIHINKNAITVTECEELSKIINSTSDMTKMNNAMSKFVANDCDSRMGESTREKRVNEIRDAFKKQ